MSSTLRPMTSPEPRRRRGSGDNFEVELRDFMRDTEMKAKRVIKNVARKAEAEMAKKKSQKLRMQRSMSATSGGRKALKEMPMNTLIAASFDATTAADASMAVTQDSQAWTKTLPANVTRTVKLQPAVRAGAETLVDGFTASRMLSRTSAATLRQSGSGRLQEAGATTAMFRESDAFGKSRNYPTDNKGLDGMEGTNAITRGVGAIRKEGLSANPGNMEVSYRASARSEDVRIGRGNKILDMGHFAKPEDIYVPQKLPSGRQRNYRGAVTTASRAENLRMQNKYGSGGDSPARGGARMAVAKIAMKRINSKLRDVSTGRPKGEVRKKKGTKIDKSLMGHIYNVKPQEGMIHESVNKDYYRIQKEKPSWKGVGTLREQEVDIGQEVAGPVSWMSEDIRVKWRDENGREELWKVSRAAKIAAEETERETGAIMPVVEISRHPIFEEYWKYIKGENEKASKRAMMRANNRRFAMDVHTVWLTNLEHLDEFKGGLERGFGVGEVEDEEENMLQRDHGLRNARDVENIKGARSQIQSVSHKRAVGNGKGGEGEKVVEDKQEEKVWNEGVEERPLETPNLDMLVVNEEIKIDGVEGSLRLTISRMETKVRSYYDTAAVLMNGRWEVPVGGGSEGLEVGRCVNVGEDTLMLNEAKWEKKLLMDKGEWEEEEKEEGGEGGGGEAKRTGETVETLEGVDAWPAARGRGFEDVVDKTTWRIEVRDERNGDTKTVGIKEHVIMEVVERAEKKKKIKFDRKKGEGGDGMVCHRQGKRLLCGHKSYSGMVTIRLKEGGEWDENIYVEVRVDVKLRGESAESGVIDRSGKGAGKERLKRVTKTITGVEARERVKLGSVAPASDIDWWSRPEREHDVWRPLVDDLMLVPKVEQEDEEAKKKRLEEEEREKMKRKKKKKSPSKSPSKKKVKGARGPPPVPIPVGLEFPERESDQMLDVISKAFSLASLVSLEGAEMEQNVKNEWGFPIKVPGGLGKDGAAKVRIKGVPEEKHEDGVGGVEWGSDPEKDWEYMADNVLDNLSVQLSAFDKYKRMVPGLQYCGRLEDCGVGDKARTRAVMQVVRDKETSSSNSLQVTNLMALETPTMAPIVVYWELSETPLPAAQHEICDPWVVSRVFKGESLEREELVSNLNERLAPVIYILSGSEREKDFGGFKEPGPEEKWDIEKVVVGHNDLGFEIKQTKRYLKAQHKHRRRMKVKGGHGLRHNIITDKEIIRPVWQINPAIFGVTSKGATGNKTGVGGRTIWHSDQRCVEVLCRVRTPLDYIDVIKAKSGSGFSDPKGYTLLLNGYHLDQMVGIGLGTYEKVYERIHTKINKLKKAEGLEAKIRQAEENLRKNRDQLQKEMRFVSQKKVQVEKRFGSLEGKQPEAMSMEAWLERRTNSKLLEERAGWEKREMTEGRHIFYFKNVVGVEGGEIIGTWDAPDDFENFEETEIKKGMMVGEEDQAVIEGETTEEMKESAEKEKVKLLLKMIAEDEGLIQTLAKKLGVLIKLDKGENLVEVMRGREGAGEDMKRFPGEAERELAEEDIPWSDSDDEQGNTGEGEAQTADELLGDSNLRCASELPQDNGDVARFKVKRRRAEEKRALEVGGGTVKTPANIPKLRINPKKDEGTAIGTGDYGDGVDDSMHIEKHIKGVGWRRLNRAKMAPNFYDKITKPQPLQTKEAFTNSISTYRMATMVDPSKAGSVRMPDFQGMHRFESLFIKDVLGDGLRVVEQTRMRKEREEELLAGGGLEAIAANQPNEMTLADQHATKGKSLEDEDDADNLAHKAIECCRTGNITDLEFILDRNIIDTNTKDENGNSLLHLCCQQGNKRMVKFMLRRGADIKTQNTAGNSVLHHCHLYSHFELAQYLLSKGADDSLVNADGCTCYEGLTQGAVGEI